MEPPPAPLDDAALGKTKAKGKILQLFNQHPLVGPVTFALGILSLAATIFFGLAEFKSRELSLYVNPSKTTIVKSGQTSDLHILYKGKDVSTDVTALQVELWNAGKESIRPEHVLSPVILATSPKVPILEATVRHVSRPITQTVLDTTQIADGKVTVSWKILEHNDAAVIQFILAGPTETSITASGALEGQPGVKVLQRVVVTQHWWLVAFGTCSYIVLVILFHFFYFRWVDKRMLERDVSFKFAAGPPLALQVLLTGLLIIAIRFYYGEPLLSG